MKTKLAVMTVFCGAVLLAVLPVVGAGQAAQEKPAGKPEPVDMGTYRVSPPPAGKWQTELQENPPAVVFTRSKTGLLTSMIGQARQQSVVVMEIVLEPAAWRLTEEEEAGRFLADLITREARDYEAPGKVEDQGEMTVKDKKIRFALFHKDPLDPGGVAVHQDRAVLLYIPPMFARSHRIYAFQSWFTRPSSGPVKLYKNPVLDCLVPVIESFETVDELESVEGPGGELLRAAAAGDIEAARAAIDRGADVNTKVPAWTPLMAAAYHGHRDMVSLLLERGADINGAEEGMDATPLHSAVVAGEPGIAAELIERGADVNARTKDGSTALLFAAPQGFGDLVSKLLEKGAGVDVATPFGETPFMFSCDGGSIETARMLLAAGAAVNARTRLGDTPLMFAARRGHADLVAWLLENGADINQRSVSGETPLWNAVGKGTAAIVKALIGAGADVNARTEAGFTPLMLAAQYGLAECVSLLIEAGADVGAKQGKKTTALKLAKHMRHAEVVKILTAVGPKAPERPGD